MEHERLYTHEEQIIYADLKDKQLTRDTRVAFAKSAAEFVIVKTVWIIVVVVSAVVGAIVFRALEEPNELVTCTKKAQIYQAAENDTALSLAGMSMSYINYRDMEEAMLISKIEATISTFRKNILLISYDGRNCSEMGTSEGVPYNFNFYGSLLFATTIMTTVGYGNIAPLTSWGRICAIAYGLISIPLTLAFLAMIGEVMADVFRFIYVNVCCLVSCRRYALRRAAKRKRALERANAGKKIFSALPIDEGGNKHAAWKDRYKDWAMDRGAHPGMVDDDEEEEDDDIPIPITLILLSVFVYIAFGAILFANWDNWSIMDGAYFSFVTISTVGFGDLIPGVPTNGNWSPSDQIKLLATAVYMILGMAFLSMAFQLIQGEIGIKFKKFSTVHVVEHNHEEDVDVIEDPKM